MLSTYYKGYTMLKKLLYKPMLLIVAIVAFLAGVGQQDFVLWEALRVPLPHFFSIFFLLFFLGLVTLVVFRVKAFYSHNSRVYIGAVVEDGRICAVYRIRGELYYERGAQLRSVNYYTGYTLEALEEER